MFTHLLVPLDGTPESAAVLPLVQMVANASRARITLVQVVPAWDSPCDTGRDREPPALVQAAAGLRRAGLRAAVTTRRVMRGDQVAAALVGEARSCQADVIVMATHVRTGPARMARGSVADQVLALSPVPVLLLGPDGTWGGRPETILFPVDGTVARNTALGPASAAARLLGAEVVVLRVVVPGPGADESLAAEKGALADAQHQVDWLAAQLLDLGIAAQGRAVFGRLPETILETAERISAGLIVMRTGARRLPAWSAPDGVAVTIARRAQQPTLLVQREPGPARPGSIRIDAVGAGVPV